jgi:outer membrane protein assembly factor BamB
MRRRICVELLSFVFVFGAARSGIADSWAQFRGPNGTGRSASTHPLTAKLEMSTQLVWKKTILRGQSSPIIVGNSVVFTGYDDGVLSTVCVNLEDGNTKWHRNISVPEIEKFHPQHGPATPTPVSDGDRIYSVFGSFGIVAYDLSGTELWRIPLTQQKNLFGTASSPILVDGNLIVHAGTEVESLLLSIDKITGKTHWERKRPGPASAWSTPTLWQYDGKPIVLFYEPYHLRACYLKDGKDAWSVPGLADEPVTIPQTMDDRVIVTSYNLRTNREALGLPTFASLLQECDRDGDGALNIEECKINKSILSRPEADGQGDHPLRMFVRLLDADKDGFIREEEWPRIHSWIDPWEHANGVIAIDALGQETSPALAWQYPENVPECATPLIWKERIYFVRNGGVVTCLDWRTGAKLFSERIAGGGPYYASPIAADDKLFFASARGELTMIEASELPKQLSTLKLGEPIWSTPAIIDHRLVVRSESTMWLFDLTDHSKR